MATQPDRKSKIGDPTRSGVTPVVRRSFHRHLRLCSVFLLFFFILSCQRSFQVEGADYETIEIKQEDIRVAEDLEQLLSPYRQSMNEQMDVVLAVSTGTLSLGHPESTLGNFAGDATEVMAEQYTGKEVAFGIQNYSGLRIKSIGEGEITLGRIYELMPFDNFLVTVQLTGDEVRQLCDYMAGRGGWPSSKSLTYQIKEERAIDIRIDGTPIVNTQSYLLATNDYIVRSSSIRSYFENKEMNSTNIYVRDAFAEYLRSFSEKGQTYRPILDHRVSKIGS